MYWVRTVQVVSAVLASLGRKDGHYLVETGYLVGRWTRRRFRPPTSHLLSTPLSSVVAARTPRSRARTRLRPLSRVRAPALSAGFFSSSSRASSIARPMQIASLLSAEREADGDSLSGVSCRAEPASILSSSSRSGRSRARSLSLASARGPLSSSILLTRFICGGFGESHTIRPAVSLRGVGQRPHHTTILVLGAVLGVHPRHR